MIFLPDIKVLFGGKPLENEINVYKYSNLQVFISYEPIFHKYVVLPPKFIKYVIN